jgi:hypothetical protein
MKISVFMTPSDKARVEELIAYYYPTAREAKATLFARILSRAIGTLYDAMAAKRSGGS